MQLDKKVEARSQLWARFPCCCCIFFFFLAIAHLTFLSVQWHGFKVRSGKQSLESSNLGVSCQFKHLLAEESLISCLLFLGKLFLLMSPV